MDLVALLVLGALAVTNLVTPDEALAGFSNSAVITVWAMFILSEGLTRTGIADVIGRQVLRVAGTREFSMIVVIMITGAVLSAFMNNIGVAALMLPVVVDIARRTQIPPARLLMPLAYSTLLGGLMTLIGTPPNLLISESMSLSGYEPFKLFDFTPIGSGVMIVGVLFMALFGRLLLPRGSTEQDKHVSQRSLRTQYKLHERTFLMRVPQGSILIGKTIAESRIGRSTGLIILSLTRDGRGDTLPSRQTKLRAGDGLLVQGRVDQFRELRRWSELVIEREAPVLKSMVASKLSYAEVTISEGSPLVSELVRDAGFRKRFDVAVVGLMRKQGYRLTNLAYIPLKAGDRVLVQGEIDAVQQLEKFADFSSLQVLDAEQLVEHYHADERMFVMRVPKKSELGGATLGKSRLAESFDFRVLAVFRDGRLKVMPRGEDVLSGGDLLLIEGQPSDLDVLRGLQELEIDTSVPANLGALESERLTLMDATLDPRTRLAGKTVGELNFRERYGIELAAIWREGEPVGTDLSEERLQIGDALLLLGPRDRLQLLTSDSDFLVLTPLGQEPPDTRRAPLAAAIMLAVVASVMLGLAPFAIAAVMGGSVMVLLRCLTRGEA
jgi:di/tricarboxylate transporter